MDDNDNDAPHRGQLRRYLLEIFQEGGAWQNVTLAEEVERRHGWRPSPAAIRYQLSELRADGLIRRSDTVRLGFELVEVDCGS